MHTCSYEFDIHLLFALWFSFLCCSRGSVSKSSKKGTSKSHYKPNDNGVSPKGTELDTSRVKVGDPFVSMDEKNQPSGGKRRKRMSGISCLIRPICLTFGMLLNFNFSIEDYMGV